MRPRQDIAPFTGEDECIWQAVHIRMITRWNPTLERWMQANEVNQDRRDADLMLDAMTFNWTPGVGKVTLWFDNQLIDVGGAELGKGLRR